MGYLYLLTVALMFSFVGTCNRLVSPYFSATLITFFRFFFGVICLVILKAVLRQPFRKNYKESVHLVIGWILFGAIGKWLAYLLENTGFTLGPSYGNIITEPAQTVFLTLSSVILFKDKLSPKKILCIIMCTLGVLCISWNGKDLSSFVHENVLVTVLFVISGACAGAHILAQKMIANRMDIIDSNLTIFAFSTVFSLFPVIPEAAHGALNVHPNTACILAILAFGCITGIGFYLNAKALPLVPLYMVPLIHGTMVIFCIIWGVLFFHETLSFYIIGGTILFMAGLIWLQLLNNFEKESVEN